MPCVVDMRFRQFVRFLAVGLLNTAFGYSLFSLLIWCGVASQISLLVCAVSALIFNFVTTGRLVFKNRDNRLLGRFFVTYTAVYLLNLILLEITRIKGITPIPGQGLCLFVTIPLSFIIQKLFVFRVTSASKVHNISLSPPETNCVKRAP